MESFKDSLAYWSSLLGTVLSFLGLSDSSRWLALLGLFLLAGSIAFLLYARTQRQRLKLATIKIEGRSIDSLNAASLARRLNRSLVVQEAEQTATINGEDLTLEWRYTGYCRAPSEAAVEFSVDTDNHVPFERLECYAYDLRNDPGQMHRIRPVLLGPDGLSKKIAVPLRERLSAQEPFSVLLTCKLPGCMKSGVEYYTSTVSVEQERIQTSTVRLVFLGERPEWLRVYECGTTGETRLLKDLRPSRESAPLTEYVDLATDVPAQSARIYVFRRCTLHPASQHHSSIGLASIP
jgi:hypothetical protein